VYLIYTFIILTFLTLLIIQVVTLFEDHKQRKEMKAVEKDLLEAGVHPYGSTLSHGMYVNKDTGQIETDQKHSSVWFKRLL